MALPSSPVPPAASSPAAPSQVAIRGALALVQLIGDFRDRPDRELPWLRLARRAADLAQNEAAPAPLRDSARAMLNAILRPVGPAQRRAACLNLRAALNEARPRPAVEVAAELLDLLRADPDDFRAAVLAVELGAFARSAAALAARDALAATWQAERRSGAAARLAAARALQAALEAQP